MNTLRLCLPLLLAIAASATPAIAADDDFPLAKPPPVQELPPPLPQPETPAQTTNGYIPDGESLEPKVRIVHRANAVVEEYRINGKLYMVRVIPRIGIPYYLIDTTGDGNYDMRTTDLDGPSVPMWVIYSW